MVFIPWFLYQVFSWYPQEVDLVLRNDPEKLITNLDDFPRKKKQTFPLFSIFLDSFGICLPQESHQLRYEWLPLAPRRAEAPQLRQPRSFQTSRLWIDLDELCMFKAPIFRYLNRMLNRHVLWWSSKHPLKSPFSQPRWFIIPKVYDKYNRGSR